MRFWTEGGQACVPEWCPILGSIDCLLSRTSAGRTNGITASRMTADYQPKLMLSLEDALSFSLHVDKAGGSRHRRAFPPTRSTARCLKRLVSSVVFSFTAWVGRNGWTIESRDLARKLSLVSTLTVNDCAHWVLWQFVWLGKAINMAAFRKSLHERRTGFTKCASSVGKPD